MARIFVLKRVNLRSLGERRPEAEFRQTDHDRGFVASIRQGADSEGIIANPGAWLHYSCAIHDTLEAVSVPNVEVHLYNVHPREEVWWHTFVISPVVEAVVGAMGVYGYRAATGYTLSVGPGEI